MSIIDLIGNTPLIKLAEINGNNIFAKLEYYNPTGSIKDRTAYYMLKGALERGDIKEGGTVIEPTSGNTGIGLAAIGARLGLRVILTLPENMSVERRQILSALGAKLELTPAKDGMRGAIERAEALAREIEGSFIPMQFENEDNALAHYEGTAPEIFGKVTADIIVAGVGSGGTAVGIKRYIIDKGIDCAVVALEPAGSPVLSGGVAGAHGIQGIGANFLPKLYDGSIIDRVCAVTDSEAYAGAKALASEYGVTGGISAGAAYSAALKIAGETTGKNIVFIVPDTALRYLSMGIYG